MEETKKLRKSQEKRLDRLIMEEKVLTSVIKQIKLQFVELQSDREELLSALNKLKEEIDTNKDSDEKIENTAIDRNIGVTESSEKAVPQSSKLSSNSSWLNSSVSDIGMDFDQVINSNVTSDCFNVNLDNIGLESEFDDALLINNSDLNVKPAN